MSRDRFRAPSARLASGPRPVDRPRRTRPGRRRGRTPWKTRRSTGDGPGTSGSSCVYATAGAPPVEVPSEAESIPSSHGPRAILPIGSFGRPASIRLIQAGTAWKLGKFRGRPAAARVGGEPLVGPVTVQEVPLTGRSLNRAEPWSARAWRSLPSDRRTLGRGRPYNETAMIWQRVWEG